MNNCIKLSITDKNYQDFFRKFEIAIKPPRKIQIKSNKHSVGLCSKASEVPPIYCVAKYFI